MDTIKAANLAMAQIVIENPIVYDVEDTKKMYLDLLIKYMKLGGWNKRKYELSGIEAYKRIILGSKARKFNCVLQILYFV